jgi:hypothetical protein
MQLPHFNDFPTMVFRYDDITSLLQRIFEKSLHDEDQNMAENEKKSINICLTFHRMKLGVISRFLKHVSYVWNEQDSHLFYREISKFTANVQENVILHYKTKTFYCRHIKIITARGKNQISERKKKIFVLLFSSFSSTHPNIYATGS